MYLLNGSSRKGPNVLVPITVDVRKLRIEEDESGFMVCEESIVCEVGSDNRRAMIVCEREIEIHFFYWLKEAGYLSLQWFRGFYRRDVVVSRPNKVK